jgi:hypothetical protein
MVLPDLTAGDIPPPAYQFEDGIQVLLCRTDRYSTREGARRPAPLIASSLSVPAMSQV